MKGGHGSDGAGGSRGGEKGASCASCKVGETELTDEWHVAGGLGEEGMQC